MTIEERAAMIVDALRAGLAKIEAVDPTFHATTEEFNHTAPVVAAAIIGVLDAYFDGRPTMTLHTLPGA